MYCKLKINYTSDPFCFISKVAYIHKGDMTSTMGNNWTDYFIRLLSHLPSPLFYSFCNWEPYPTLHLIMSSRIDLNQDVNETVESLKFHINGFPV